MPSMKTKTIYPVGAHWSCQMGEGVTARIGDVWLDERLPGGYEVWNWKVAWGDGSGCVFDWDTGKRAAVYWCSAKFSGGIPAYRHPRFMRVKENKNSKENEP